MVSRRTVQEETDMTEVGTYWNTAETATALNDRAERLCIPPAENRARKLRDPSIRETPFHYSFEFADDHIGRMNRGLANSALSPRRWPCWVQPRLLMSPGAAR